MPDIRVKDNKILSIPTSSSSMPLTDDRARYPIEPWKTVAVAGLVILALIGNLFALAIVHDLTPRENVLPDMAFNLIPYQAWAYPLFDVVMFTLMTLGLIILIVLHPLRSIITRRWLFLAFELYVIRMICLTVTVLPTSLHNNGVVCAPVSNHTNLGTVTRRVLHFLTGVAHTNGTMMCGDLIYSGHTIQMCLACFMLIHYTPKGKGWIVFRYLIRLVAAFGLICLVISRAHYVIDVLIAYLFVTLMFRTWVLHKVNQVFLLNSLSQNIPETQRWVYSSLYHSYADYERSSTDHVTCLFMLPIKWLEKNVPPGPLPNRLAFPFSKPTFMVRFIDKLNTELDDPRLLVTTQCVDQSPTRDDYGFNTNAEPSGSTEPQQQPHFYGTFKPEG